MYIYAKDVYIHEFTNTKAAKEPELPKTARVFQLYSKKFVNLAY